MLKNVVANFIGKFWSLFSVFLFVPLYIDFLGFTSYSVISFTLMLAGLMAILDGGLTATLSREFARTDKTSDEKRKIFGTLESSYIVLTIIAISLLFFFSNTIAANWLNVEGISIMEISLFIKLVSFEVGLQMLFRFYLGGLFGLEKQVTANVIQIGWGVFRNGLVVFFIYFFPTLQAFFIWQLVSTFLFTLILKFILQKNFIGNGVLNLNFYINKYILKEVWHFAGGMMLISIVAAVNTQLDKLIISKMLSIESLGYYTLALSLSTALVAVVNPISVAILPRFTALYSAKNYIEATQLFVKVNLLTSIIIFSLMANMVVFSKELVWIWTGKVELAEKVFIYLPILALSYAMLSMASIPYNIAIANGYTKLNNILGIVSLFFTIPCYYFAIKSFGILGIAVVFLIMQTTITILYYVFINRMFLKIDLLNLLGKKFLFPLAMTLIISFAINIIPFSIWENRFISLMWIGMSSFVTACLTSFVFLEKETKRQIGNLICVKFSKLHSF